MVLMVELSPLSHRNWWRCGYFRALRLSDVNLWQIVGILCFFLRSHNLLILLFVHCEGVRGTRDAPLIHGFQTSLPRRSSVYRAIVGLVGFHKGSPKVFEISFFFLFLSLALNVDMAIIKFVFNWLLLQVILLMRRHRLLGVSFRVISLLREHWVLHQIIMDQLFLEGGYLWVLGVVNILEIHYIIFWIVINLVCHGEASLMAAWLFKG